MDSLLNGANIKDLQIGSTKVKDLYLGSTNIWTRSEDNYTFVIHRHTEGNGVPIILMGDGFIEEDMRSGAYKSAMLQGYEAIAGTYPYKSMLNYLDVYYINTVSDSRTIDGSSTYFSTTIADDGTTLVSGDDYSALYKGLSAMTENFTVSVPQYKVNNMLCCVIINSDKYAGTCYMYHTGTAVSGVTMGYSVGYIPMSSGITYSGGYTWEGSKFKNVFTHEVLGHGFGKLADEYYYDEMGTLSESGQTELKGLQDSYGFYNNVDITSSLTDCKWSSFIADDRFKNEYLGCYEGGYTYSGGVWRPTFNSLMFYNEGYFNAPSRQIIFNRIRCIADKCSSVPTMDEFIEMDAEFREEYASTLSSGKAAAARAYEPMKRNVPALHSPVIKDAKEMEIRL